MQRYVLSVAALLALVGIGTKLHKVARIGQSMEGHTPWESWLVVSVADVIFAACWTLIWLIFLHGSRGWLRGLLVMTMHVLAAFLLLLLVIEHGFFLAAGALLDWELLAYTAEHLEALKKVISSEMGAPTWAALVGVVLLAFVPLWPMGRPAMAAEPVERWRGRKLLGLLVAICALAALYGVGGKAPLPDKLQPIRGGVIAEHVMGAVNDWMDTDEVEDIADIKPLEPLLVTPGATGGRHNVVVIVLESTRAQATTPYNPDLKTSPFLASLAKRGTLVENAYTVVPHTTKALVPIHCGLYPKLVQRFDEATPGALPSDCLARVLGRMGYASHHIQSPESVFERRRELVTAFGFERISGMEELPHEGFQYVGYFGYEDDVMIQPSMDWIDAQQGPFLLSLLTVMTHHPYQVPRNFPKGKWGVGRKLSRYYDTIAYTDRFLKKLFAGFEKRGLMENTIFVLVGDHGEAFGEHGTWQHDQTPYEEGLKVPLLFLGPGIEAGRRVAGLWQLIDIVPTLLEALDLRVVAGGLPGRSVLSDKPHTELRHSCWQGKRCQALRRGDLKFIHFFDRRPPEVFDLAADPLEKHNLLSAGEIERAEVDAAIASLADWVRQTNGRYEAQARRRKDPFIRDRPPARIQHRTNIVFDKLIRMIGFDVERTKLRDGDAIRMTYYFEVLKDPGPGWLLFVHAVGPRVKRKSKRIHGDHVPVEGSHPVPEWQAGQFITDHHWMRVRPGYPSGDYKVLLGFYNTKRKNRRAIPRGTGSTITSQRSVHLVTLDVTNPKKKRRKVRGHRERLNRQQQALVRDRRPADLPAAVTVEFGDVVRLIGADKARGRVRAGESIVWTWYFEPLKTPPRWTDVFVHVIGPAPSNSHYLNAVHVPVLKGLPVHQWRPGEVIVDPHRIKVPANFPPGSYEVWLGFWDPNLQNERRRYVPVGPADRLDPAKQRVRMGRLEILPRKR